MIKKTFKHPSVSVWLVPKKEQEDRLRETIDRLAGKYNSSGFIPHISVYVLGNAAASEEVIKIVKEEVGGVVPIEIEAMMVGYSDAFTQTLYVQYKKNDSLVVFYNQLKRRLGDIQKYELNPHLSLVYSHKMSNEDKEKEMKEVDYPKMLVLDRAMVIVKDGGGIAKEEDVLDWRVELETKLLG
jgi:hypothetical protein